MGRSWGYLERGPLAAWGNPAAILSNGSGLEVAVSGADLSGWRDLRYGALSYDGFTLFGRRAAVNVNYTSLKEQNEDYNYEDYDEKTIGAIFAMEVAENIRAGIGVKRLRQHHQSFVGVDGPDSANAFPIWDGGLMADIPLSRRNGSPRVRAGVSLNNLGPTVQRFYGDPLDLPLLVRCAIGLETQHLPLRLRDIGHDRQVHWIALSSSIGIEERLRAEISPDDSTRVSSARDRIAFGVGLEVKILGLRPSALDTLMTGETTRPGQPSVSVFPRTSASITPASNSSVTWTIQKSSAR
jgi:hypothetical protein